MKQILVTLAILLAITLQADTYEIYDYDSQKYYEVNDDGYNSYVYDYQEGTYEYRDIEIRKKESLYDKYYDDNEED